MPAGFKRLGIQKRIMLYVMIGLTLLFAVFALLGFRSVQQATELVYGERLNTAHTTAGILNRDFLHVSRDVVEASPGLLAGDGASLRTAARDLLDHLSKTDPFPFFQVTGVWVLEAGGRPLAWAGTPELDSDSAPSSVVSPLEDSSTGQFEVLPMVDGAAGGVPFATVATRLTGETGLPDLVVAVHTESTNSQSPYVPTFYWQTRSTGSAPSGQAGDPQAEYYLEVVNSKGRVVLGMGGDERPGETSHHFAFLQNLMAEGKAATFLHKPGPGDTFNSHVMAVVPLAGSFYVVLEQPEDVAMALLVQMRQGIVLLIGLGFLAALLVAWVTTRQVVKPTEQLTLAALRIARGDLESPIVIKAQDEVGNLAESLDTMRQRLLAAYQQIENANRGLELQVRERTARLGEVLKKLISAQEEERRRLARELHDETAQTLGALSIALDKARDRLQGTDPEAVAHVLGARAITTRLLEETRRLILDLRPQALDDLGLGPAIRWYVETHLEEQGVAATVEIDPPAARLPEHIEVTLFRVVQEAVNNIARHARAKHVRIRWAHRDSTVKLVITDDGKGFDADQAMEANTVTKNVGLIGMRERVSLLNGSMEIRSREGEGTEISIEIPVPGRSV